MEGSIESIPLPSDSNQTASGASKFLANLPSRGHLSSTVLSSNPGGMRVYICCHETSPPEGQHIKTNQQNILIRSLTLRNKKAESSLKNGKAPGAAESSRKRTAERGVDSRASVKRANSQSSSKQEGSTSEASSRDFQGLTVERLRVLLKAKGLSLKGKKDELIARLRSASG